MSDASDAEVRDALEAYNHFRAVRPQDLLAEFLSSSGRDDREVSLAMEAAVDARVEELEDWLLEAEEAMDQ